MGVLTSQLQQDRHPCPVGRGLGFGYSSLISCCAVSLLLDGDQIAVHRSWGEIFTVFLNGLLV